MKRLLSCILCVVLVLLIAPKPVVTAIDDTSMTVEEMNNIHNEVRALLRERSFYHMYNNSLGDAELSTRTTSHENVTENIDARLAELGVRQGTLAELGFADHSRSVDVPDTSNENWYLETYIGVIYHGVRYEVSVLTAQASNKKSDLYDSGSKTLHAAPGVAACVADYIRILATAASGTIGSVIGTIYDAVSATVKNFKTSTVIEDVTAAYIWHGDTIMHYAYVKRADSDFEPRHTYTYNEANAFVSGTTIKISFNDGTPNNLTFSPYEDSYESVVYSDANNLQNAVDCFLNYPNVAYAFVDCMDILGVGGKRIAKYYTNQEVYPSWLY